MEAHRSRYQAAFRRAGMGYRDRWKSWAYLPLEPERDFKTRSPAPEHQMGAAARGFRFAPPLALQPDSLARLRPRASPVSSPGTFAPLRRPLLGSGSGIAQRLRPLPSGSGGTLHSEGFRYALRKDWNWSGSVPSLIQSSCRVAWIPMRFEEEGDRSSEMEHPR